MEYEDTGPISAVFEKLSVLMAEQTNARVDEVKTKTGYNPTPAELTSVFEGIKAEIEALGN